MDLNFMDVNKSCPAFPRSQFLLWLGAILLSPCVPMPATARVTKMWIQQKGLIPFLFLAFAAYFLYDGAIGYPRSDKRWDAHERLKDKPEEWEKYATEQGWKTTPPEHRLGPGKYTEQFVAAGVTGLVGMISLIYWHRNRRRVIRNDEEGIYDPLTGHRVAYGEITRIDKSRWKKKGYAYIHYTRNGKSGSITFDDAKYDPTALETILAETEGKVAAGVVQGTA